MPNIEIHGLERIVARELKDTIFSLFKPESYVDEMVVTIFPTEVRDKDNNDQPFLRLANSCQAHTKEILEGLKALGLDIEHLHLEGFYPKTEEKKGG